jgi:tripartite-type tricarboxylate transporter receptor subunit TctC
MTHCVLTATLGLAAGGVHGEQSYPSRPLRFIVAFAPGRGSDIVARFVAQKRAQ